MADKDKDDSLDNLSDAVESQKEHDDDKKDKEREIKLPFAKRVPYLRWWLLMASILVGGYLSWKLGFFHTVLEHDVTKISMLIFVIFVYMSIWCGYLTWRISFYVDMMGMKVDTHSGGEMISIDRLKRRAEVGWFFSDQCLTLGMIGTVIGFIIMLAGGFQQLTAGDTTAIQILIGKISAGMATALYTTLVGLICSVLLKIQYFNLSRAIEETKA